MKNRRTIIITIICIALIASFILLTSYAYWRVSVTQTGQNEIQGACLSINYVEDTDQNGNPIEGITLENTFPMRDDSAMRDTKSYNFTITNTCDTSLNYQIVLDSLPVPEGKEINPDYINIFLSGVGVDTYGSLKDANTDGIKYDTIASKVVYKGIISKKSDQQHSVKTFTLQQWINSDAPNTAAGKEFKSKIRVVAGQGIEFDTTPEYCFDFDSETGTITGYDEENCTTDYLILPETINGVTIKSIDFASGGTQECLECQINWNYLDLTKAIGLETIGYLTFGDYTGDYRELVIPDSVQTIDDQAFVRFTGNNLVLGSGLKSIGADAFWQYEGGSTRKLIIPEGVETIGRGAFSYLNGSGAGITIMLPSTIQHLEGDCFGIYRKKIYVNMTEEEFENVDKAVYWDISKSNIYYLK